MIKYSNIIRISLYCIIAFIMCLFFPWWIIAAISTFIGFFAQTKFRAIIESTIVVFLCWFIMIINNFFIDESKFLIINKMQNFLGMNQIVLIIITIMIPLLVGTLASLFGYQLRKVVSDD